MASRRAEEARSEVEILAAHLAEEARAARAEEEIMESRRAEEARSEVEILADETRAARSEEEIVATRLAEEARAEAVTGSGTADLPSAIAATRSEEEIAATLAEEIRAAHVEEEARAFRTEEEIMAAHGAEEASARVAEQTRAACIAEEARVEDAAKERAQAEEDELAALEAELNAEQPATVFGVTTQEKEQPELATLPGAVSSARTAADEEESTADVADDAASPTKRTRIA
jgi:hypothetical protein